MVSTESLLELALLLVLLKRMDSVWNRRRRHNHHSKACRRMGKTGIAKLVEEGRPRNDYTHILLADVGYLCWFWLFLDVSPLQHPTVRIVCHGIPEHLNVSVT